MHIVYQTHRDSDRVRAELVYYIELCHLGVLHFATEECRHLANSCTAKCDCIGLMLFRSLTCSVCDALVACCATGHLAPPLSMNKTDAPR